MCARMLLATEISSFVHSPNRVPVPLRVCPSVGTRRCTPVLHFLLHKQAAAGHKSTFGSVACIARLSRTVEENNDRFGIGFIFIRSMCPHIQVQTVFCLRRCRIVRGLEASRTLIGRIHHRGKCAWGAFCQGNWRCKSKVAYGRLCERQRPKTTYTTLRVAIATNCIAQQEQNVGLYFSKNQRYHVDKGK